MPSRDVAIRSVLTELEQQRDQNYRIEKERETNIRLQNAYIDSMFIARAEAINNGMLEAIERPADSYKISDETGKKINGYNLEIRKELVKMGYPDDYLQPIYNCPLCRDTGYVGEPIHDFCSCVQKRVMKKMTESESLQILEKENFAHFDESIFPDTPIEGKKLTQRGYIIKIRERCEKYADTFDEKSNSGLLFTGKSGLGKSYMMHCVLERILSRGFSGVRVSAYRMAEVMRSYQFDQTNADLVEEYLKTDILAIDDLGSEPFFKTGNSSLSGFYYLLNERLNTDRPVILTTNLDYDQVYDRYGDRIGSRLWNKSRMSVYEFIGVDVKQFLKPGQ